MKKIPSIFTILLICSFNYSIAQTTLLYSFAAVPSNGAEPYGSLIQDGSTLYGMTNVGGSTNDGTIFKIGTDGNGFSLLHSFIGGASDGERPYGNLIQDGSTLYGMTMSGGSSNYGVIFKIGTDGNGFSLLHTFTGVTTDGGAPNGSLIQDGTTLYGMTNRGGSADDGTIFKIETSGTGFSLLHSFTSATDGRGPFGALIQDGNNLYGTAVSGGSNSGGTIFKIETNGTGFSLLHSFTSATDGNGPYGTLTQVGATLYGTASAGGSSDNGTIYKIGTDGTGFSKLHTFGGGASDGRTPYWGDLIQYGTTLYGTTIFGGSGSKGTIFQIETDGSGFSLLHSFLNGATDGEKPYGSLIRDGNTLYGMTYWGGGAGGGTIFKYILQPTSVSISGNVRDGSNNGIEGAAVAFSNGGATVTTSSSGYYATSVSSGWSGTSTATKNSWTFTPTSYTYPPLTTDQTNQNYVGTAAPYSVNISGYVRDESNNPMAGVAVAFSNGGATVTTNATGHYLTSVSSGWGGTSTATKTGWAFTPESYTYSAVTANQTDQDYKGRDVILGVNNINSLPTDFTVLPAYPNPFNPSTTISYGLDSDSYVMVEIYDVTGKLMSTIINAEQSQGWHSVVWNGTNHYNEQVPSGVYLSKLTSNNITKTIKLMLLK